MHRVQACSGCCTDVLFNVFGLTSCYTLRDRVKPVGMNITRRPPQNGRWPWTGGYCIKPYHNALRVYKVVLCVHRGGCRVRIFFYDTVGRYAVSTKGKNYFTLRFKARVCAPLPSAAHTGETGSGDGGPRGMGPSVRTFWTKLAQNIQVRATFYWLPYLSLSRAVAADAADTAQPWESLSLGFIPLSTKHSTGVPYFVFSAHNDNLECSPSP